MAELSPYLQKVVSNQIKAVPKLAKSVCMAVAVWLVIIIDRSWSMA
jgi:hypothetical protein